ncbi:AAEL009379-PA [Aedes aegypti]|uniref:Large ribosomal subunit protein bL33m n=2 Tax=Aedes aegypti TaxID=7159 RepID=A0A903UID7_AEDAE|nr:39S ribosomal protein L33, mitochondrial [Aedes aegypti]EAT38758.1 AAEL009379-PA [Aedes aegypti]
MFLTNLLLKKAKSKNVLVLMESAVSGHQFLKIRERLADKLEMIRFDPYIQRNSLYKERKRVRSLN